MSDESIVPDGRRLLEGLALSQHTSAARLLFGGDIAPVRTLEAAVAGNGAADVFSGIRAAIEGADLFVANLECPLTRSSVGIAKDGPTLRADPRCAPGLKSAGLDVLTLANNHIMDLGESGLIETMQACRSAGLQTVGAGRDLAEASRALVLEVKGCRIAIIAIAEREFSIAGHRTAGAAPLDPIRNIRQLREASAHADVTIVSVHGGNEYFPLPRPGLVEFCRFLIDGGAHAVICHHTHVAAPVEIYRGAPIAYSTGNLLFDNPGGKPASWHHGCLIELGVAAQKTVSVRVIPFEQSRSAPKIVALEENAAREFLERLQSAGQCLLSHEALDREWRQFCRSRRERYLLGLRAPLLFPGIGAVFRRLPFLYRALFPQTRRLAVLDLIQCESHREALETLLADKDG